MNDNQYYISQIAHESDMARMEQTVNRLWIALLVTITLLVASNAWWVWRESQFEDVVVTQEAEADTGNALVNNGGDLTYGGTS